MVTYISGTLHPPGSLHIAARSRLQGLGPVVAEFDGRHTATALAPSSSSGTEYSRARRT
jgi:hypothetical protein